MVARAGACRRDGLRAAGPGRAGQPAGSHLQRRARRAQDRRGPGSRQPRRPVRPGRGHHRGRPGDPDHPGHDSPLRQPRSLAPRDRLRADQGGAQSHRAALVAVQSGAARVPRLRQPVRRRPVVRPGERRRSAVPLRAVPRAPRDQRAVRRRPVLRRRGRAGRNHDGQHRDHRYHAALGVLSPADPGQPAGRARAGPWPGLGRSHEPRRDGAGGASSQAAPATSATTGGRSRSTLRSGRPSGRPPRSRSIRAEAR